MATKMKVAQVSKAKGDLKSSSGTLRLRDQVRSASRYKPAAFATAISTPRKVCSQACSIRVPGQFHSHVRNFTGPGFRHPQRPRGQLEVRSAYRGAAHDRKISAGKSGRSLRTHARRPRPISSRADGVNLRVYCSLNCTSTVRCVGMGWPFTVAGSYFHCRTASCAA